MLSVAKLVESKHAQLTVPAVLQLRYLQDEKTFHEEFEEKVWVKLCDLNKNHMFDKDRITRGSNYQC